MKFWRFIAAGTLLACLVVLGLTAVISHTPATQVNQTADYTVRLGMDATSLGNRTVSVELTPTGTASNPSPVIDGVMIVPTMPLDGMAAATVIAQPTAPGRYVATGVQCAMAGVWDFAVQISVGGREETAHCAVTMR